MATKSTTYPPGGIDGFVFDVGQTKKDNIRNPIFDAVVEVFTTDPRTAKDHAPNPAYTAHTDVNGAFAIKDLAPGTYYLRCAAFSRDPRYLDAEVKAGCTTPAVFEIPLGFSVGIAVSLNECQPPTECDHVTAGRLVTFSAYWDEDLVQGKPVSLQWKVSQGTLRPPSADNANETTLDTTNLTGDITAEAILTEPNSPQIRALARLRVSPAVAQPIRGNIGVRLQRSEVPPTADLALWAAIRNHSKAVSFGGVGTKGSGFTNAVRPGRGYQGFIDRVLCGDASGIFPGPAPACGPAPDLRTLSSQAKLLPLHGMAAYELLVTATEIFLLWNCGIAVRSTDALGNVIASEDEEFARSGLTLGDLTSCLGTYLGSGRLPYIERVVQTAFPGELRTNSVFCTGVLTPRVDCACLIELIWSYWHEEGMLVQSLNAISRRFQNVRAPGGRDPLAHLEIDPLRPLNNLLWGYVQSEDDRLTVKRRSYEYDHHYGLAIYGKAVPMLRGADSRSKFLEGFHNLLHLASMFYKEDNDTTVIADGFPLLNGLKEVHLLLAQGAHNQFGDLPWTARVEMMVQQWLMARPEMRDFLQSRAMVPYTEAWMPQVDTMKTLQGWSDVTVTHFHDLAVYGEQILLSIRYGDWIALNDENHAKNWARSWRPEVQGYIHAYRAVTGIDLTSTDTVDYTMPAVHLQKRLALQRAR